MNWKTRNRSFYYEGAPEPDDPPLDPGTTALLVIDVQNTYRDRPSRDIVCVEELARYDAWTPFYERLNRVSIPNIRKMLQIFRQEGIERVFARIACQTSDGRDRSLSQKKPGWNNILLPKDGQASQVVEEDD
jgi:nicotinamidase-related amidase